MSLSLEFVGLRPATDEYRKKVIAYKACMDAGVTPPKALQDYFNHASDPDPTGMELTIHDAISEFHGKYHNGYEVDLKKLPEGVTRVRVVLSY